MSLTLPDSAFHNLPDRAGSPVLWDSQLLLTHLQTQHPDISLRTAERAINECKLVPTSIKPEEVKDEAGHGLNKLVRDQLESQAKKQRQPSLVIQSHKNARSHALMANDPAIVLADEPTGNLDLGTGTEIIELLREMNQNSGVTIISATHDHKMLSVSDRVVWIVDGQIDRIADREDLSIEVTSVAGEE